MEPIWRGPLEEGWERSPDGSWLSPRKRRYAHEQVVLPDTAGIGMEEESLKAQDARSEVVEAVLHSRTAGYARKPHEGKATEGFAHAPWDADDDEAWAVESFLAEADDGEILMGLDGGCYGLARLVEWLAWTGQHTSRYELLPELHRRAREAAR